MNATVEQAEGTWRAITPTAPPRDRTIRIVANLVDRDEWSTGVEPYEGLARWNEESRDWLDEHGMSIRGFYESDLIILEWAEANTERRFAIISHGPVIRLAPRRPVLAALPAPAWHTTDPYRGDYELEFRRCLDGMSSAQLFELLEEHDQFTRAWIAMSAWRTIDDELVEGPVLKGGSPRRNLHWREESDQREASERVEDRIQSMLLNRYRSELAKRSRAGAKAATTRRRNAQREQWERAEDERVGAPFRRSA